MGFHLSNSSSSSVS